MQTGETSMSIDTIEALDTGVISPAQYWIRHMEAWTLIADVTPVPETEDFYRDLEDIAGTLAELLIRQGGIPVGFSLN